MNQTCQRLCCRFSEGFPPSVGMVSMGPPRNSACDFAQGPPCESVSLSHRAMSNSRGPAPVLLSIFLPSLSPRGWHTVDGQPHWACEWFHKIMEHEIKSFIRGETAENSLYCRTPELGDMRQHPKPFLPGGGGGKRQDAEQVMGTPADVTEGKGQVTRDNRVSPGGGIALKGSLFDYSLSSLVPLVWFLLVCPELLVW